MSEQGLPWYKRNPEAFLGGIRGVLTSREIAVYSIVLDLIYLGNGATRNLPKYIAGHTSDLGPAAVRNAIISLAEKGKLTVEGDMLFNKKATKTVQEREEIGEKRAKAGKKGGKNSQIRRVADNDINDLSQANADRVDKSKSRVDKKEPPIPPKGGLSDQDIPDDQPLVIPKQGADWPPNAFEQFYDLYPHKIGKQQAIGAFEKLRKSKDPPRFADLIAGLHRYIQSKPADRSWCNPATWLNQGRWEDEPATETDPINGGGSPNNRAAADREAVNLVFRSGRRQRNTEHVGTVLEGQFTEGVSGAADDGNQHPGKSTIARIA